MAASLILSCAVLLGLNPAPNGRGGSFQVVFADRTSVETDELDSASERGTELVDEEGKEYVEVRSLPHSSSFQRRHGAGQVTLQRELQHQLELTRAERGQAESMQASEQREAEELEKELELAKTEKQRAQGLLQEAREELASKSEQVAAAKRIMAAERAKARHDVDEAAEEVYQARHELQMREGTAKAALKRYQRKFQEARSAEKVAKQQSKVERLKAAKAAAAVKAAEEQRQKHFKAAVNMRAKTQEVEALVEQVGREEDAAKREKAHALAMQQQAYRDRHIMSRIACLLAIMFLGVLGFAAKTNGMELSTLRPAKLLEKLRGCAGIRREADLNAGDMPEKEKAAAEEKEATLNNKEDEKRTKTAGAASEDSSDSDPEES